MEKKRRGSMENVLVLAVLSVLSVALGAWLFHIGGTALLSAGFKQSAKMFLGFVPLMAVICLVGGFGIVLSLHYQEWLNEALSGKLGPLMTALAGALFPSFSGYPLATKMWNEGFSHGNLMVFFGVGALFNILTVLFRAPMMGGVIAAACYAYILAVTIVSVPVFRFIGSRL